MMCKFRIIIFLLVLALVWLPKANGQYFSYCESGTQNELTLNVERHDQHILRLNKKFEDYYYYTGELPDKLPDEEIARVLDRLEEYLIRLPDRNAAIIFYAYDEKFKRLCTWMISSHSVVSKVTRNVDSINITQTSSKLLDALHVSRMANDRVSARGGSVMEKGSEEDGNRELILPIINEYLLPKNISEMLFYQGIDTLIVVPILGIGAFPFPLLEVEGASLIERMSIIIAPSIQSLLRNPGRVRNELIETIVVGDPCEKKCFEDEKWEFKPLKGARREAKEVAQEIALEAAIIGREATIERVITEISDKPNVDLIYVATHGVADAKDPNDESFLLLSDGRWTARQISGLTLNNCPLVVMSACQTGLGKKFGVGTIGLARAWEYAGASNVVMSLWNVDDDATETLMTNFIKLLSREKQPDRALQEAMLQVKQLEQYSDPVYWAGFSVFGVPER